MVQPSFPAATSPHMDRSTWINSRIPPDPRIRSVGVTDDEIIARYADGRKLTIPLAWSERLSAAPKEQRHRIEILDEGELVHWPDVGEFLSAQGLLHGTRARLLRRSE